MTHQRTPKGHSASGHRKSRATSVPASRAARLRQAEAAFEQLLAAIGRPLRGELRGTPRRAARLWIDTLLAGEGADLQRLLAGGSPARAAQPVSVLHIGVYLVCPHHLTVAFGEAHLAYLPTDRLAGFGALAELARSCTARLVLQEDATFAIAEALVVHLGARAAVATIRAAHPCHRLLHPRSHRAQAITWAECGDARAARRLRSSLREALSAGSGKERDG